MVERVGGVRLARGAGVFNPDYPPIVIPRDPSLVLGTVLMRCCTHGDRVH